MKKILYIDLLSPRGHSVFNKLTLNALKEKYKVLVVERKKSYKIREK